MEEQVRQAGAPLVSAIERKYRIVDSRVRESFIAIPRKIFLAPFARVGTDAEWDDDVALPIKWEGGRPISSSTQPTLMAMMLDALNIPTGARVLEIGAGTGYNAALIAHIAGPDGLVVSLDVEEDVLAVARASLSTLGISEKVHLLCREASEGAPEFAPFNRIICTAATPCIPRSWYDQLSEDGLMLVPFQFRGLCFLFLCKKNLSDRNLTGDLIAPCGFMPLRGPLYQPEHYPMEVRSLEDLKAGGSVYPLPNERLKDPQILWSFALWLAVHDPCFRVLIEPYAPHHGSQKAKLPVFSLFVSNDSFAILTADGIVSTARPLVNSLQRHYPDWLAFGLPAYPSYRLAVGFAPATSRLKQNRDRISSFTTGKAPHFNFLEIAIMLGDPQYGNQAPR